MGNTCSEISHGFLDSDTVVIAGQKCVDTGLFWL